MAHSICVDRVADHGQHIEAARNSKISERAKIARTRRQRSPGSKRSRAAIGSSTPSRRQTNAPPCESNGKARIFADRFNAAGPHFDSGLARSSLPRAKLTVRNAVQSDFGLGRGHAIAQIAMPPRLERSRPDRRAARAGSRACRATSSRAHGGRKTLQYQRLCHGIECRAAAPLKTNLVTDPNKNGGLAPEIEHHHRRAADHIPAGRHRATGDQRLSARDQQRSGRCADGRAEFSSSGRRPKNVNPGAKPYI